MEAVLRRLADKRLKVVGGLRVGILAGQSALISQKARGERDGGRNITDRVRRLQRLVRSVFGVWTNPEPDYRVAVQMTEYALVYIYPCRINWPHWVFFEKLVGFACLLSDR